jgi:hypothetical protein
MSPSLPQVSSVADGQRQFAALAAPTALPAGSYFGKMLFFNGSPLIRAIVGVTWKGIDFEASRASITFSGLMAKMARKDEGPVSLGTSIYDGQPCIRIEFVTGNIPRFYETRSLGDGRYLSVVTMKQPGGSNGPISDINLLWPIA